MSRFVIALERKVGAVASLLARVLLVLAVCAGLWQVSSRFLWQDPSAWTEIATRTLLVWCVFLGIVVAFRRGALVSVDLMMQLMKGRNQARLRFVIAAIQIAFLMLLAYVGFQMAWLTRFQNMVALDIPMSFAYLAIPVGALLSVLAVLAHFFDPAHRELETSL